MKNIFWVMHIVCSKRDFVFFMQKLANTSYFLIVKMKFEKKCL